MNTEFLAPRPNLTAEQSAAVRLMEKNRKQRKRVEMEELKPCPFCGSAPRCCEIENSDFVPNAGGEYIECPGCGVSTVIMFSLMDDAKPHLVERWNERAPSNPLREGEVENE